MVSGSCSRSGEVGGVGGESGAGEVNHTVGVVRLEE